MASPSDRLLKPPRPRTSHIPGYFEGFVEKLDPDTKDYKKFWTVLRGSHLCFQVSSREPTYLEKVDLDQFVSMSDGKDQGEPGAKFTLKLKRRKLHLRMYSVESREEWKGFIHTVVKLEIPKLNLLPGQIQRLLTVRDEEIDRRAKSAVIPPPEEKVSDSSQGFYDDVENSLPSCFYKVSRMEAETVLKQNSDLGNILLRPGSNNKNFSITTRQIVNDVASVKHYRVCCSDNGYIIDVDQGISQSSLQDVIDYFVQYTNGILKPLDNCHEYEEHLTILQTDDESGEVTQNTQTPPPLHRKPGHANKKDPNPHNQPVYVNTEDHQPSWTPRFPPKPSKDEQGKAIKIVPPIFGLSTVANLELQQKLMKRREEIEASESKAGTYP